MAIFAPVQQGQQRVGLSDWSDQKGTETSGRTKHCTKFFKQKWWCVEHTVAICWIPKRVCRLSLGSIGGVYIPHLKKNKKKNRLVWDWLMRCPCTLQT